MCDRILSYLLIHLSNMSNGDEYNIREIVSNRVNIRTLLYCKKTICRDIGNFMVTTTLYNRHLRIVYADQETN